MFYWVYSDNQGCECNVLKNNKIYVHLCIKNTQNIVSKICKILQ